MDIEIVYNKKSSIFEVWTAGHKLGAIIGVGLTIEGAKADAIRNMLNAIKELES